MKKSAPPQDNAPYVVGYVRVSTEEQELGPVAQEQAIRAWCTAQGLTLHAVHVDHLTGATEVADRPGMCAAIADLGPGCTLLALKRDRLARDVFVAATVERLVLAKGAVVATVDGAGNGDGPEAALMRHILDAFAAYERALIRCRTKAGLAVKKARGERTGSVPTGYMLAADGKRLLVDPRMVPAARLARKLRVDGVSQVSIGVALHEKGHLTPDGQAKPWHSEQVGRLLRSGVGA